MKILAKIKKRPLVLGILFAILLIGIVYAADYYQVNSGATSTIDEWSVCKKVTNNNALAIFVPTKTADEWTAFRTYASGVSYAECLYCQDSDGDGYGVCPNCGIAAGCTYDGDDCCDSDSRAYPGEGTYYSSKNNCGSWDYDCSGTTTKHTKYCDKCTDCPVSNFSAEVCARTARTISCTGTNSYYTCGATATNTCYFGEVKMTTCACWKRYLEGLGSYTVSRLGQDRLGGKFPDWPNCAPDGPIPVSSLNNPKCTCK